MIKKYIVICILFGSLAQQTTPAALLSRIKNSPALREAFLQLTPQEAQKRLTEELAKNKKIFKVTSFLSTALASVGAGIYLYWLWQHYRIDSEYNSRINNARAAYHYFDRAERENHVLNDEHGNPQHVDLPHGQAEILRALRDKLQQAAQKMNADGAAAGVAPEDRFPREVNMRNNPTKEIFNFLGISKQAKADALQRYNHIHVDDQHRRDELFALRLRYMPRYLVPVGLSLLVLWAIWFNQAAKLGELKAMALSHGMI